MENRKVKHGEIFCYDFGTNEGSIQNGIRPALVIQANNFNANSPTTVITTAQKGAIMLFNQNAFEETMKFNANAEEQKNYITDESRCSMGRWQGCSMV